MMRAIHGALILSAGMAMCGCTGVQYVTRPALLPTVAPPVLTPIKSDAVACLSDATYTALVNRERALREWGLAEEAVIKANNAKAKP